MAGEASLVVAGSFALAVVLTWPAMKHPTRTIPHDLVDSALMGWEARWGAHALLHQPGRLFDANAFYPDALSYAFSDTLLGFWPLGLLGNGPSGAALAINLIYLLAFALPAIGGYALARQLGANAWGALVAGLASAYAPWRLTQLSHLHVISTGGILLALAMLARGHGYSIRHGWRPQERRLGWIVAGWLVAAGQMTIGFGSGLVFAYVLGAIGVVALILWWRRWRGRGAVGRGIVLANLGGGLVFGVVSLLMARPYLMVLEQHPYARRSINELGYFSPWPHSFIVGPGESLLWQADPLHLRSTVGLPGEMALLCGFTLYLLAGIGVKRTIWPRRWGVWLGIGVLFSMLLALGIRVPVIQPYRLFYELPGWDGLRTPGRLVVWTTVLLALLAAGAVTAFTERATFTRVLERPAARRAVASLAAALVLLEGVMVVEHLEVPKPPGALTSAQAQQVPAPLLILPSTNEFDALVMLWSTDGFPPMVNGLSGFTPAAQREIREGTAAFPDAASIELLRRYGVRSVVVLPDRISGTPWEGVPDRPVDGLGITRTEFDGAIVFSLDG